MRQFLPRTDKLLRGEAFKMLFDGYIALYGERDVVEIMMSNSEMDEVYSICFLDNDGSICRTINDIQAYTN